MCDRGDRSGVFAEAVARDHHWPQPGLARQLRHRER
jgi:hypothetical protein